MIKGYHLLRSLYPKKHDKKNQFLYDEEDTFSLTARLNNSEDVKSIDSIVNAYYTIVSDSNHQALDFERLKFLHLNTALIVKMDDTNDTYIVSLEAEYSAILCELRMNSHKIELSRIVTKHGHFAQVLSTYEIRTDPKVATTIKGRNSIQVHYSNDMRVVGITNYEL